MESWEDIFPIHTIEKYQEAYNAGYKRRETLMERIEQQQQHHLYLFDPEFPIPKSNTFLEPIKEEVIVSTGFKKSNWIDIHHEKNVEGFQEFQEFQEEDEDEDLDGIPLYSNDEYNQNQQNEEEEEEDLDGIPFHK